LLQRAGRQDDARQRFELACQADPTLEVAKSMLDQLDAKAGVQGAMARRPLPARPAVVARPAVRSEDRSGSPPAIQPVSSPAELRRTPLPIDGPPSGQQRPAADDEPSPVKLQLPVPISSRGSGRPAVKPAAQPRPQPANLRFPVRTVAAHATAAGDRLGDLELPTPDQLHDSVAILDGDEK
jgi:hypothetical protein